MFESCTPVVTPVIPVVLVIKLWLTFGTRGTRYSVPSATFCPLFRSVRHVPPATCPPYHKSILSQVNHRRHPAAANILDPAANIAPNIYILCRHQHRHHRRQTHNHHRRRYRYRSQRHHHPITSAANVAAIPSLLPPTSPPSHHCCRQRHRHCCRHLSPPPRSLAFFSYFHPHLAFMSLILGPVTTASQHRRCRSNREPSCRFPSHLFPSLL